LRSREFKELEIVVLRHELAVLRRQFAPEELAASVVITLVGDLYEPPLVNVCRGDVGEAETFALLDELVPRIAPTPPRRLAKRLLP
jgi:hypothetical protein